MIRRHHKIYGGVGYLGIPAYWATVGRTLAQRFADTTDGNDPLPVRLPRPGYCRERSADHIQIVNVAGRFELRCGDRAALATALAALCEGDA